MVEHREGLSFRVAGRTLSGRALVYGDTADMGDFRERFEPGAFGAVRTIPINLQHDPRLIVTEAALLTDSARSLDVRADLPEGSAALALVRRGRAQRLQHRIQGAVRTPRSRCSRGRAGRSHRPGAGGSGSVSGEQGRGPGTLRPDDAIECAVRRIPGVRVHRATRAGSGGSCIPEARFSKMAGEAMADLIGGIERDILVVAGNYRRPLASASRGTLRATSTDAGLEIEVDLPAGAIGDEVIAAHEAAGVIIRPFVDPDRSEIRRRTGRPHVLAPAPSRVHRRKHRHKERLADPEDRIRR